MVSDRAFVEMCRDKRNTGAFFEGHGIRVPQEVDKYNPTFPLFAKPYDGSLSTNLHYIKNAEELTQEILMKPYPQCQDFTYVGDNLNKDFVAPHALGWTTICLRDDGRNIHKQVASEMDDNHIPQRWILNISEIYKD